jgi:hypothetical protein
VALGSTLAFKCTMEFSIMSHFSVSE